MEPSTKRQKLESFARRKDSLRIAASNISAVTGFHPWKNLPELFLMDLVYQGSWGKALLRNDAALLEIQIMEDPNEQFRELAAKAGIEKRWKDDVMSVKNGSKKVHSVQEATLLKSSIIKQAEKKLSKDELKSLREGVRSAVDTGYGTSHEDSALDQYESRIGFPVTDRNAEVRSWPFQKAGDASAAPISKATAFTFPRRIGEVKDGVSSASLSDPREGSRSSPLDDPSPQLPFFYITGSVDGIRDELAVEAKTSSVPCDDFDNDDVTIRSVIVECKHRMSKLQHTPPLYEQIQAITYMFMYEVQEADILQVLRLQTQKTNDDTPAATPSTSTYVTDADISNGESEANKMDDASVEKSSAHAVVPDNTNGEATKETKDDTPATTPSADVAAPGNSNGEEIPKCAQAPEMNSKNTQQEVAPQRPHRSTPKIIISAHRVSLHDPIQRHHQEWDNTILPRLRSFVDAVYRVRSDDGLRYEMLAAVADTSSKKAWECLFVQCPWLQYCDTAYQNERA